MKDHDISLDNYINGDLSICREERQYALYLSNILRYYGRAESRKRLEADEDLYAFLIRIYRICGIINSDSKDIPEDLSITDVFYEATFMRDFLERNRRIKLAEKRGQNDEKIREICRQKTYSPTANKIADYSVGDIDKIRDGSFNYSLLMYVAAQYRGAEAAAKISDDLIEMITEKNYGHNELPEGLLSPEEKKLTEFMMNAKPDIAVIYSQGNTQKILFLECKFESREDSYKKKKPEDGDDELSQTLVQWHIADFLKSYLNEHGGNVEIPDSMNEQKRSVLVPFGRDQDGSKLEIEELIRLERIIFNS